MEAVLLVPLLLAILAAPLVYAWRYPIQSAIAVLAWLILEESLLLALPDNWYAAVRVAPEAVLFVAAASSINAHFAARRRFQIMWPETCVVLTLIVGLLVALVRDVEPAHILIGVRWLFRYVSAYLIWRLSASESSSERLIRALVILLVAEASIGLAQGFLQSVGIPILEAMQARVGRTEFGGVEVVTGGTNQVLGKPFYVFGTLGRYNRFGLFVAAAGILVWLSHLYGLYGGRLARLAIIAGLAALVLSTSRQGLILATLGVLTIGWLRIGISEATARSIRGASLIAVTVVFLIAASDVVSALREGESIAQRLLDARTLAFRIYYLAVIVPNVLVLSNFVGLGTGTFGSRPHVMENADDYLQWGFPGHWSLQYSYDSEWAILLGQYGVLGFLLFYAGMVGFGILAFRHFRESNPRKSEQVLLAATVCFSLAFPLLGLVGAELGSRTTSYVVWSVLGASMALVARRSQDTMKENVAGVHT